MATQSRIGWRPYVSQVVNAVDADAQAFIAAAGITDLTQAAAISTLVNDLKTYGLWSKMKALYPFVGGNATSHKFNLKDPRDLDAAYRLVFSGGWVHTSNGATPNGTTAYADTKLVPSVAISNVNSLSISNYSRTQNTSFSGVQIGCYDGTNGQANELNIYQYYSLISKKGGSMYQYPIEAVLATETNTKGFQLHSRTSSTIFKLFFNNNLLNTNTTLRTGILPILSVTLGASNRTNGGPLQYTPHEHAFDSIGDGLSDTEATNFYTAVQKFQTTLGRQVGTPYVSDADAVSFLNTAGITDGTQAVAINTLVIDLKAAGIWTKMKAIYPFVGGTATSHKFNLKDPRDLDVSYRLQFNGGWTHNSNGVTPNGSNGFARTFFVDTNLSINSVSYSIYNRSNTPQNVVYNDFGYFKFNSAYVSNLFTTNYAPYGYGGRVSSWAAVSATRTDYRGFYNGNRTNSTDFNFFLNGTKTLTQTDNTSGKLQTGLGFVLGCLFNGTDYGDWSTNNYAFAHISDGLTDTEAVALHRAVQKYQTTLGRQIDVPLVSDTDAQSFLTAAGITSYTQANAINTLVTDLKSTGIWTKMKAIYPFVGGSATSHKWNLKDPRDLDVAYRLVFNGGWVHSSTGALPNGTTGYADTFLKPSINLNSNEGSLGYYSRTNNGAKNVAEMGAITTNPQPEVYFQIHARQADNKWYVLPNTSGALTNFQYTTDSSGFYQGSRLSSTTTIQARNNITSNENVPYVSPSTNVLIGARTQNGSPAYFSDRESGFAYIGNSITSTDITNFYTAVQKFQTALGRQVGTPVYNTNGLVLNLDAGVANSYPGTGTTWFDLAAGNNGTLVNGPTYDINNGGSISFDGINDYVNIINKAPLNDTDFTYDFWFRTNNNDNVYQTLITQIDGDYSNYVALQKGRSGNSPGNIYFQVQGNNLQSNLNGVGLVAAGIINYTAVAKKENGYYKLYLYRNGVLDNSMNTNIATINMSSWSNLNTNIGRNSASNGSYGEYLNGNIYSGKVYNRALSATEVLQNFNSSRGRFGI